MDIVFFREERNYQRFSANIEEFYPEIMVNLARRFGNAAVAELSVARIEEIISQSRKEHLYFIDQETMEGYRVSARVAILEALGVAVGGLEGWETYRSELTDELDYVWEVQR